MGKDARHADMACIFLMKLLLIQQMLKKRVTIREEKNMITSTANPQIKNLIQLQKKNRLRQEQGIFIIEGIKMYREAPTDQVIKTYVSESFYKKHQKEDIWKGESLEIVTDRVFEAASDTKTPQGVLSLVKRFEYDLDDIIQGSTPLIMVLENIQDPGNLGTIVRTGEGAGITGVIMSNGTVDIYNSSNMFNPILSLYKKQEHTENTVSNTLLLSELYFFAII